MDFKWVYVFHLSADLYVRIDLPMLSPRLTFSVLTVDNVFFHFFQLYSKHLLIIKHSNQTTSVVFGIHLGTSER